MMEMKEPLIKKRLNLITVYLYALCLLPVFLFVSIGLDQLSRWIPILKPISYYGFGAIFRMVIYGIPLLFIGLQVKLSETEKGYEKRISLYGIKLLEREYCVKETEFKMYRQMGHDASGGMKLYRLFGYSEEGDEICMIGAIEFQFFSILKPAKTIWGTPIQHFGIGGIWRSRKDHKAHMQEKEKQT